MEVRALNSLDYSDVSRIYLEGILTGQATFQTEAPDWLTWDKSHLTHSRIVGLVGSKVAGWAALTPVSGRCVYAGVAEVSVYIANDFRGRGLGKELLTSLIRESEENGIWMLQAGIFPENTASVQLHSKCGFRTVGYREKIGKMNETWRDTVLMERRSKIVGVK